MYRRSKFLEILIAIREEMAREADYDTDLFAEMVRSGRRGDGGKRYSLAEPEAEIPGRGRTRTRAKTRS
ncbi:MAG: hypothetical protein KF762_07235 [Acidobacteria bacterium]|nr:hypothetical protein [Acidobacteriota bacterium]